ncbi:putative gramicidin dehydrogenase [Paratrimastix pyriformis]|uniref:Gramicidin dehydrogenase n=1 Tax=Paratrimastix pyriformis TaxID=342808 RepID=A0ABQ8UR83_9EUKA|nr:putative gramicidin dehydrogenase [Paratrimastix pyriformis]
MSDPKSWLLRAPTKDARLRVFCFPYTGGGGAMFCRLPVPPGVDLIPLQYPGRQSRLREQPIDNLSELTRQIIAVILPILQQAPMVPFCFFGYSMGGVVAIRVAQRLQNQHCLSPRAMLFAATVAPHKVEVESPPIYTLPEAKFIARVTQIFSMSPMEVEVMSTQQAALRADLQLIEDAAPFPEPCVAPLQCPFVHFYGTADTVYPRQFYEALRSYTSGAVRTHILDGLGHFFDTAPQWRLLWEQELAAILARA